MLRPWFALSFKAVQLGIDAQNVMALRMMRLASGGTPAQNEMTRMVIEKATAAAEAQLAAVGAAMAGHKGSCHCRQNTQRDYKGRRR